MTVSRNTISNECRTRQQYREVYNTDVKALGSDRMSWERLGNYNEVIMI